MRELGMAKKGKNWTITGQETVQKYHAQSTTLPEPTNVARFGSVHLNLLTTELDIGQWTFFNGPSSAFLLSFTLRCNTLVTCAHVREPCGKRTVKTTTEGSNREEAC